MKMTIEEENLDRYEVKPNYDQAIENSLDMQKWLNDPDSKKRFKDIIKDIPLSNLDPREANLMFNFGDFSHQLHGMKLKKAEDYFLFLEFFLANISLGKGGFAKKLTVTSIFNQSIAKPQDRNKQNFWGKTK